MSKRIYQKLTSGAQSGYCVENFTIENNGILTVGDIVSYENIITNPNDIPNKAYVDTHGGGGGSGTIGGSGISGYISKWVGSETLDNSNFYDTGTKVGLGTIVPAVSLQLSKYVSASPASTGIIQEAGFRIQPSNSTASLDFGTTPNSEPWLQATDATDLSITYPLLINPNGGYTGFNNFSPTAQISQKSTAALEAGTGAAPYSPIYDIVDNTGVATFEIRSSPNTLYNTFIGKNASAHNTTGYNNTVFGVNSFYNNTTGFNNTSAGYLSLYSNTIGNGNTALGGILNLSDVETLPGSWALSYLCASIDIRASIVFKGNVIAIGGATSGISSFGKIFANVGGVWSTVYTYTPGTGAPGGYFYSIVEHNGKLFAGCENQTVHVSTDGISWTLAGTVPLVAFTGPIYNMLSDTNLWVLSGNRIYYTVDECVNWVDSLGGWAAGTLNSLILFNGAKYMGRNQNLTVAYIQKYNVTWNTVYTLTATGGTPQFFAAIVWNGKLYFGCSNGQIISTSDGSIWRVVGNVGANSGMAFVVVDNLLFVSSDNLIYKTTDGLTWVLFTTPSPAITYIYTLLLDNSLIYAGGYTALNNGIDVFTIDLSAYLNKYSPLYTNSTGSHNTAVGAGTLFSNDTGYYNTAIGSSALFSNISSYCNTAVGAFALYNNLASPNVAFGYKALYNNTIGYENTAIGNNALYASSGYSNTSIGDNAGKTLTTGSTNTFIGASAGYHSSQKIDAVNSTAIGQNAFTTLDNQVVVGNSGVVQTLLRGTVGVATESPAASASIDLGAVNKALLVNRLTTTQRNALTPVNGMVIYNSSIPQFQAYENSQWIALSGYSGYSGWSGVSGYSAWSGYSGVSGFSSYSGWSGVSGYSAWSGYSGESGYSAWSGYSGESGYSSFSGYSGFDAQAGYSGPSGYSGESGAGYSGESGYSGAGYSGESGYSGFDAQAGYSGPSGYSGESGAGYSGESGYSGTSGYSGISGYSGVSGIGISGYSGLSGYSGVAGAGSSTSYLYLSMSVDQTTNIADTNPIKFNTASGNITYNTGSYRATLSAGNTYELIGDAMVGFSQVGAVYLCWWDVTNNVQLGTKAMIFSMTYTGHYSSKSTFTAIVAPSAEMVVEARIDTPQFLSTIYYLYTYATIKII